MEVMSFDLDGTLLRRDKTVSKFSIDILKMCRDVGKILIFNSARPPRMIYEVLPSEFHGEIFVSNNGGMVSRNEEIFYKNFISKENTLKIIRYFEKEISHIFYSVEQKNESYSSYSDEFYIKEMMSKKKVFLDEEVEETPQFFFEIGKLNETEVKKLKEFLPEDCKILITDGGRFAFISMVENNKLNGIKKVLEKKEKGIEDVVAFGDDHNDYELIVGSGIGVAMENAENAIKEAANHITLSNDDDGVAHFIKSYILNNK